MTEREIQFRSFASQDQDAARALILTGLGEHFGLIDETLNPDLDDINANYVLSGHPFLLAEHQQKIVGTGALLIQSEANGELVRISTASTYRRLGIARTICEQLIQHARQQGLRRLIVETTPGWDDPIRLYQRLDFVEYERTQAGIILERLLV